MAATLPPEDSARAARRARERQFAKRAEFLPCRKLDFADLPAIRISGVLVFAYVDQGTFVVAVDLDDAASEWEGDRVPLRIYVSDATVFEASG
jgi:hypothetical protein